MKQPTAEDVQAATAYVQVLMPLLTTSDDERLTTVLARVARLVDRWLAQFEDDAADAPGELSS